MISDKSLEIAIQQIDAFMDMDYFPKDREHAAPYLTALSELRAELESRKEQRERNSLGFAKRINCPLCGEAHEVKYTYQGVELLACPKAEEDKLYAFNSPNAAEQGELKPCPFCTSVDVVMRPPQAGLPCDYYVSCNSCKMRGPRHRNQDKTRQLWNTRPAPEAEREVTKGWIVLSRFNTVMEEHGQGVMVYHNEPELHPDCIQEGYRAVKVLILKEEG